jgi:hypothetical protein
MDSGTGNTVGGPGSTPFWRTREEFILQTPHALLARLTTTKIGLVTNCALRVLLEATHSKHRQQLVMCVH